MNTAGSVAYGWGVLCVAAGVSFYFAKQEIDARRRDQQARGARPTEQLTWQERIAQQEKATAAAAAGSKDPAQGRTPLQTSVIGGQASAAMNSKPTGVDTPQGSANSQKDR